MSVSLTRRQWLFRSGTALGGALVAGRLSGLPAAGARLPGGEPLRMMFNENPYGPSGVARKAMLRAFDEGNLYTRAPHEALRKLIAQQVGLTPDHVLLGSGSREVLNVAGLHCGLEDGALLTPHPTFEALDNYAQAIGTEVIRVPLDDAMNIDLAALRQHMTPHVKLVYICNPNNPTGKMLPADRLRPFCEEVAKKALVFVDEAYFEYVSDPGYRSMIGLVKEGHNVIVSRTASKVHGLAGLRVGFGFARPELVKKLRTQVTGTLNLIGLRAAIASYSDPDFQAFSLQKNREARDLVCALLQETGRPYLPSHTNFLFLHTGKPIQHFQKEMLAQGIRVGRAFPPYTDWCRLSLAKPEQMQVFARAFRQLMG